MAHFGLLHAGEFTVDQEQFNPTCHLCIQNVTPSLTAQSELRYITIHLKSSKTDPLEVRYQHDHWLLLAHKSAVHVTAWDLT